MFRLAEKQISFSWAQKWNVMSALRMKEQVLHRVREHLKVLSLLIVRFWLACVHPPPPLKKIGEIFSRGGGGCTQARFWCASNYKVNYVFVKFEWNASGPRLIIDTLRFKAIYSHIRGCLKSRSLTQHAQVNQLTFPCVGDKRHTIPMPNATMAKICRGFKKAKLAIIRGTTASMQKRAMRQLTFMAKMYRSRFQASKKNSRVALHGHQWNLQNFFFQFKGFHGVIKHF